MALIADATVLAALIAAAVAGFKFLLQRRKEAETLRHALFAELRHIHDHYRYATAELPSAHHDRQLQKRLKWSKFGEVIAVKELGRYAVLGAREMQQLLQIALRIRNTDQLIDMLLASPSSVTGGDLQELRDRMKYVSESADILIAWIKARDSRLAALPEAD